MALTLGIAEGRVVWSGPCSAVDALAAFGVVGVLMRTEEAEPVRMVVVPNQNVELLLSVTTGWPQ